MLVSTSVLVPEQIIQFLQRESDIMPVRIAKTIAVLVIILVISDFNPPY